MRHGFIKRNGWIVLKSSHKSVALASPDKDIKDQVEFHIRDQKAYIQRLTLMLSRIEHEYAMTYDGEYRKRYNQALKEQKEEMLKFG